MKKIFFFTVLGISLFIIIHLVSSIYTLWHKQDLLTKAQHELQKQQQENKKLHQELTVVDSEHFIEEEARNKLLMVKSGERAVLIAPSTTTSDGQKSPVLDTRPNWQQWLALFSL